MPPSYVDWLRTRLGSQKVILTYVTALIRDERGRLLFQRRTDFDWWGLPGGVLELGETFAGCVRREAREETGWDVEPVRLVGVYAGPQYDVRYPNGDEVQQCTVALECRIVGGRSQPDGVEAVESRFFAPDGLPNHCPVWYAHMARDCFQEQPEAVFEPPLSVAAPVDGSRELRQRIGSARIIVVGVGALIQNEAGQVLLGQRHVSGLWALPAGMMELGETPAGAVVRAVRAELGIAVEPLRLLGAFTGASDFCTYPDGNRVQVAALRFACRWTSHALRVAGVETLTASFFDPDALPPMSQRSQQLLHKCLKRSAGAAFE